MKSILTGDPPFDKVTFRQMAFAQIELFRIRKWLTSVPKRRRQWRHFERAKQRMETIVGWSGCDPRFRSSECYDTCYRELLFAYECGEVPS